MNENIQQRIDQLKKVVLDLHRSAGKLDAIIQTIESEIEGNPEIDARFLKVFVESKRRYREGEKSALGYDILNVKEEYIWAKLIESIKGES